MEVPELIQSSLASIFVSPPSLLNNLLPKIAEWVATFSPFEFVSFGKDTFATTIASSLPSGEVKSSLASSKISHSHGTDSSPPHRLFVRCTQIRIANGGGSGNPTKVIPDTSQKTVGGPFPLPHLDLIERIRSHVDAQYILAGPDNIYSWS
jgi:hypothetical protein